MKEKLFLHFCSSADKRHPTFPPIYDLFDHTNQIFNEKGKNRIVKVDCEYNYEKKTKMKMRMRMGEGGKTGLMRMDSGETEE